MHVKFYHLGNPPGSGIHTPAVECLKILWINEYIFEYCTGWELWKIIDFVCQLYWV